MTIYISRGCYSATAIQGMMAKPEDREAAVSKLIERVGGKLLAYYVTLGEFDWLLISEFPNEKALSSISSAMLAAAAGGGITNAQTTVAMTSKQAMDAFREASGVAASFKSAGR
jgi:uncharacterized protein with GYD domain